MDLNGLNTPRTQGVNKGQEIYAWTPMGKFVYSNPLC